MTNINVNTIPGNVAQAMTRHDRRRLAKANGLKNIPGTNRDHITVRVVNAMKEKGMPPAIVDFYHKNYRMPTEEEYAKFDK